MQLMLDFPQRRVSLRSATTEERAYVIQGTEKPSDLPRLRESAATMEAKVLAWFEAQADVRGFSVFGYLAQTPTQCADGLGLKLTTVRPRITQLLRSGHLERCAWIPRRATEDGGSEGYFRYREDATDAR